MLGTLATVDLEPVPKLLWNVTASVPTGLYRLRSIEGLHVGDIVAVRLPIATARFLAQRGSLPLGVPLLKPVAAVGGQTVCRTGLRITIDGATVAVAKTADDRGRPLPVWQGCQRLSVGQVFVMNPAVPTSLDSRYFGALPLSSVLGSADPLWVTPFDVSSKSAKHGG